MRGLVIGSFFVLFALIFGMTVTPDAYADHGGSNEISIPLGTSVSGCDEYDDCYSPSWITIEVGEEVDWINYDTTTHTITTGNPFDGPNWLIDNELGPGDSLNAKGLDEGVHDYFCQYHPWMTGVVEVLPLEQDPVFYDEPEPEFEELFQQMLPLELQGALNPEVVTVTINPGTSIPGCEETQTCFSPHEITVQQGSIVEWYNGDPSVVHTVTSGSPSGSSDIATVFDSSLMMYDTYFAMDFYDVGKIPYFCMVHPWMEGIVNVIPYGGSGGADPIPPPTQGITESIQLSLAEYYLKGVGVLDISGVVNPVGDSTDQISIVVYTVESEYGKTPIQIAQTFVTPGDDGKFRVNLETGGTHWDANEGDMQIVASYKKYPGDKEILTYEKGDPLPTSEPTDYTGLVGGLVAVVIIVAVVGVIMAKKKGPKKIPSKSLKDSKLKD